MIALIQALENLFATNTALKAAFPGYNNADNSVACVTNFWEDLLPENAPLNPAACVYSVVASVADPLYPGTAVYAPSENTIRFTAYAAGKNLALAACETLTAQMDSAVLNLSTGTISNWIRRGEPLPQWDSKDNASVDVWGCSVVYDIAVDPLG